MSIISKIDALLSKYKIETIKENNHKPFIVIYSKQYQEKIKELLPNGTEEELNDLYEIYEERAGIIEYDGGLDRKQAEEMALEEIEKKIKAEKTEKVLKHELVQEVFKTFSGIKIDSIKFANDNQVNNGISTKT